MLLTCIYIHLEQGSRGGWMGYEGIQVIINERWERGGCCCASKSMHTKLISISQSQMI